MNTATVTALDPNDDLLSFEDETFTDLPNFDLALRKTIVNTAEMPFTPGNTIIYQIEVFNQGNRPVQNVLVQDMISANGLIFNPTDNTAAALGIDNDWTIDLTGTNIMTSIDIINPGQNKVVTVKLRIDPNISSSAPIMNTALIFEFEKLDNTIAVDEDFIDPNASGGIPVDESDNDIEDESTGGTDNILDEDGSDFAMATICDFPVITVQPQNAYSCRGEAVSLSVTATGNDLRYQWQEFNGISFQNISGATLPSYTINQVTFSGRRYRVIVSVSANQNCPVQSQEAIVFLGGFGQLTCNNLVQISMDADCQVEVTPDMILEAPTQGIAYQVQVMNAANQNIGNIIDRSFVGNQWLVKVINPCNENSCWSYILVEDKLAPTIDCLPDVTVSCTDASDYATGIHLPPFRDNCDQSATIVVLSNILYENSCNDPYIARREIRFQAKDKYNNVSAVCTRNIYYTRTTLAAITLPKNYDGTAGNNAALKCSGNWDMAPLNGYPDPSETGWPLLGGSSPLGNLASQNNICRVNATFSDDSIRICNNSFKVLRSWTLLDWCSGQIRPGIQIIKVVDDEGPVVTIPPDVTANVAACQANINSQNSGGVTTVSVSSVVNADPYTCTGRWEAVKPIIIYDCSGKESVTYEVDFLLPDASGNAPVNGVYTKLNGGTSSSLVNGKWVLTGLPVGCVWIRYTFRDGCGNISYGFTEIRIVDKTPPVAVCDEFTVVTLSSNGWARIYAGSFDDGSHDNCTSVTFEVRRPSGGCGMVSAWGEYVDFCCSDVQNDVMVELRVTDKDGNSNTCMVMVEVQDKIPPVITCPSNLVLNCGADTSAIATGKPVSSEFAITSPYYLDNCGTASLTWKNTGTINSCGEGTITRTYLVTDKAGNTNTCSHTITLKNTSAYSGPSWVSVGYKEVEGCLNTDTNPDKTGRPVLNNPACSQMAVSFTDQVFPMVENVCFKILRKWTVVDWCKFRVDSDPATFGYPYVLVEGVNSWTYIQTIKVKDESKPTITTDFSNRTFQLDGPGCGGQVTITEKANDCSATANIALKWSYNLKRGGGIIKSGSGTGSSLNASAVLEPGNYTITWNVADQCGNSETKTYEFTVRDNKMPTPYCLSDITTVLMPSSGMVSVTARSFDRGAFDNCPGKLVFSFSSVYPATQVDSLYTVRCSDFGQGKDTIQRTLRVYVWDQARNGDYCTVRIIVQKNSACNSGNPDMAIGGRITTCQEVEMKAIEVSITDMSINQEVKHPTDDTGTYLFKEMNHLSSFDIRPYKNDEHLKGVSTLDLVLIQRHILGLSNFTSPCQHIAADANKDKKVTASDLVELRKLILGQYIELPKNTSFRFFNKKMLDNQADHPMDTDEHIYVTPSGTSSMDNDFVAIKTGDVNGSYTQGLQNTDHRSKALPMVVKDEEFKAGSRVSVPVSFEDAMELTGMQGVFNYNTRNLRFLTLTPAGMPVSAECYVHDAQRGDIRFSWYGNQPVSTGKGPQFYLEFEVLNDGLLSNNLQLEQGLTPEAYDKQASTYPVVLAFRNDTKISEEFTIFQNVPNPFSESTRVPFFISKAGNVELRIFDARGTIVYTTVKMFGPGQNEFEIQARDLGKNALLFYELKFENNSAIKKMLHIMR